MSILFAIVGLGLLIVLHEGGHFLAARLCGMRVERFSVGFGKPLVSFKRGDTIYQIAPIPFGGFVQITGLNPHEEFDKNDPYVYPNRPRWMRMAVLAAGPVANYLTAVVLGVIIFLGWGKPSDTHKIDAFLPGSAGEQSGLRAGDVLVSANGTPVSATSPISIVVRKSEGKPVAVIVKRDGVDRTFQVTPRKDAASGAFMIGVRIGNVMKPVGAAEAMQDAVVLPAKLSVRFLSDLGNLIKKRETEGLQGPVGIAREMAAAAKQGAFDFLQLLLALSTYLGFFNLLPLPALDGGRLLFQTINALPIKEISAKTEAKVHTVGLLLLLGVFVLVTFKDLKNLVVRILN